MSAIADAIEKLVHHCLNNLDTLVVKRIRTRSRGDLVIDNGAGANITLRGDKVLINGLQSGTDDIPGIGDIDITDCLWTLPGTVDVSFAATAWGSYSGMFWTGTESIPAGLFVHGYLASNTSLVSENKTLPNTMLTRRLMNQQVDLNVFAGENYILEEGWLVKIIEIGVSGQALINLTKPGTGGTDVVVAEWITEGNQTFVYTSELRNEYNAVVATGFPLVVVQFGDVFSGSETSAIEIDYVFQASETPVTNVVIEQLGAYLILQNHIDVQGQELQRVGSVKFSDSGNTKIHYNDPSIVYDANNGNHRFVNSGVTTVEVTDEDVNVGLPILMQNNPIRSLPLPEFGGDAASKDYVDLSISALGETGGLNSLGTNESSFTINIDNMSGIAGAPALWFNRGSATEMAGFSWYDGAGSIPGMIQAVRTYNGSGNYPCSINVDRIYFGVDFADPTWIGIDYTTGNLVVHLGTGKSLKFENGV